MTLRLCKDCIHVRPDPHLKGSSHWTCALAYTEETSPVDGELHRTSKDVITFCYIKRASLNDPCGPGGALWKPADPR